MPSLEIPKQPDVPQIPEDSTYYTGRLLENIADTRAQIGSTISREGQQGASTLNQGAKEIGSTAAQFGQSIVQQGQQYFSEAKGAIDDAKLNTAYASASVEFSKAVQDRMSHPYDQNGNPTFGTLSSDIGQMGNDIMSKYSQTIGDPQTNRRFTDQFTSLVTGHTISSLSTARNQQMDYSAASLNKVLGSTVQNGLQDTRDKLPFHYSTGLTAINNGLKNGYLTAQQAQEQEDQLRTNLFKGSLSAQNRNDPNGVAALLNNKSNDQLNITQTERMELEKQNQASLRDQAIREKQIVTQQQQAIKEKQNFNAGELELSLLQGKAGESDIMSRYQQGDISHDQYVKSMEGYVKATEGNLKTGQTLKAMSNDMQQGKVLSNYSEKDIDTHYTRRLSVLKDPEITDKAMVASDYKAPVQAFSKELSLTAQTGSPQDIAKAAKAYDYTVNKQPVVVSKMNAQDRAFYATVNEQLQYTTNNQDQVINNAKQRIYGQKEDAKNLNDVNFSKQTEFKPENIAGTINSAMGMNHIYGNDKVSPDLQYHLQSLLKQAYRETGDVKSAQRMLKDETSGIVGVSEVNNPESNTLIRDNLMTGEVKGKSKSVLMFAPPDKVYDQYTPQELRQDLNKQVSGIKLPDGVSADDVSLGSDELTRRSPHGIGQDGKATTSYNMYYTKDGVQHPVLDSNTGQPLRWLPNVEDISKSRISDAQDLRTGVISGQARMKAAGSWLKNIYGIPSKFDQIGNSVDAIKKGIASVETGQEKEPYTAETPLSHKNGTEDTALGKYQILESNLASWSKEAVGRTVSREEFLNSPELQEKIAGSKMGEYMNQYHNVQDVMAAWQSGRPLSQAVSENAHDANMGTQEYVNKAMAAMAKDGHSDPNYMVSSKALGDMSANVISHPEMGGDIANKAGDYLTQYTEAKNNTGYVYGAKNSSSGGIDCSGWVAENTLKVMEQINKENGNMYDMGVMKNILNQAAAYQITSIAKTTGFIDPSDVKSGNVPAGSLIGVHYSDSSSTANSRPLGIAHVVQVVSKNGELYISQSTDGLKHAPKYGVSLMPYKDWIKTFNDNDKLYAVNPFQMISSVHMANKQQDKGTNNFEVADRERDTGVLGAQQKSSDELPQFQDTRGQFNKNTELKI